MGSVDQNRYPDQGKYIVPEKNLLVLSCIDLRLTDDLTRFLDSENLTNRYDHFVLAGTSLCTCTDHTNGDFEDDVIVKKKMKAWEKTFYEHLDIAKDLHDIKDVYIIEHSN